MHWFDVDSSVDSGSLVSEGGYGPNTDVKKNSRRPSVARKTDDLELPAGAAGLPSLALLHTDYEVWGQVLSFSGFCAPHVYNKDKNGTYSDHKT